MAATALPAIILLILAVAATTTVAHPSDKALLLKKCTEALGKDDPNLVTFCTRDLLAHRAPFLATCDRRKTVAVVLKEAHNKAKAFKALEGKINSDKSLSAKEAQDLKKCWGFINKVVSSAENYFSNALVEEPSGDSMAEFEGMDGRAAVKENCHFSVERQRGVWLEVYVKAKESLRADMVAMGFVDHLYSITH